MPKGLGLAGAAGLTSALVTLSVISGGGFGMLLAYVTPLPLVMVGLALGFGPVCLSLAVGALVLAVADWTVIPSFLAIGAVPALLVAAVALRARPAADGKLEWSKPGLMLLLLAFGAAAVTVLMALSLQTEGKGIEDWLREQAAPFVESAFSGASGEVKSAIVGILAAILPAMVGLGWLAMTLVNGLVGQWAVTRAGRALRPTPDYASLRLPLWLAPGAALVAVASLIGGDAGYLARNVAILMMAPFLVAGLVEVHASVRGKPLAGLLLAVFYVFCALFGWLLIAVTVLGVVRQWMRSRDRDQERENGSHSA